MIYNMFPASNLQLLDAGSAGDVCFSLTLNGTIMEKSNYQYTRWAIVPIVCILLVPGSKDKGEGEDNTVLA
jgi:hypothetical protein